MVVRIPWSQVSIEERTQPWVVDCDGYDELLDGYCFG